MKKIFMMIMVFVSLFPILNAAETLDADKYFIYNGFRIYDDQNTNKVSYSIKVEKQVSYKFELKYYYNDKMVETCTKNIKLEENEGFTKVTCEIQKLGDGKYIFDAELIETEENKKQNIFNFEYLYGNKSTKVDFKNKENKTEIIITIEGEYENIQITNEIPKDVIPLLNDENKDSLIYSSLEYEILEEDPLIAWNVEKTPVTINYTVNKEVSQEQMKQFKVEITETKSFAVLKYLMLVLILTIIVLMLKPIFKKNAKK